jgi:hypothetical protein
MPVVQRGEFRLAEPFDDCEDGSVDEADVGVSITVAQLADPPVVLRKEILDAIDPVRNVVEHRSQHSGMESLADPVIDRDEHWGRYDKWLCGRLDQAAAGMVVRIAAIERSVERASVED